MAGNDVIIKLGPFVVMKIYFFSLFFQFDFVFVQSTRTLAVHTADAPIQDET